MGYWMVVRRITLDVYSSLSYAVYTKNIFLRNTNMTRL